MWEAFLYEQELDQNKLSKKLTNNNNNKNWTNLDELARVENTVAVNNIDLFEVPCMSRNVPEAKKQSSILSLGGMNGV